MIKERNMVTVNKIHEKNGIAFFHIHSNKFKTVRLDIFLVQSLDNGKTSRNALIPYILKRGSRSYPTQQELSLRLEELYGAGLEVAIHKKGENQLIHLSSNFVSDQFTANETSLFDETGSLMLEVLTGPVLDDVGLFRRDYFEQEKENLIQRIKSRVNDKMHYAMKRCMEEMCKGEPFAIYEDGDEQNVKTLSREALQEGYCELLEQSPVYVYVSGNVRDDDLYKFIHKFDSLKRNEVNSLKRPLIIKETNEVRRVEEPMDVSQGKLCLGFRTQIEASSPDYYPLAIYNGVLGGGVHSKLFQNVREKESLAYSAFSRLEKFKGLLVICSGIDISQREKAEKIIMEQLKAIQEGSVSDMEMEATKKSLDTGLESMQDSQGGVVDFYLSQHLSDSCEGIETFLEKLTAVNKQDVIKVSRNINPDTVYFLTSLSGEGI